MISLLLLAGCASFDGKGLVPGASTSADVEKAMGRPAERITLAGGDSVWFYPKQPTGMQTWAVRLSPEGVVRSVDQRLTTQNLRNIVPGTTRAEEVRALLGPPWRTGRNERLQRDLWDYSMLNEVDLPFDLTVQFSADGLVREVVMVRILHNEPCGP